MLLPIPGLVLPSRPGAGRHAWHLYQVRVTAGFGATRDDVIDALDAAGIGTSVHFIPVHQLSGYRDLLGPAECTSVPVTDRIAAELLSLPMYPGLTDAQVDRVAATLRGLRGQLSPRRSASERKGGQGVELAGHAL